MNIEQLRDHCMSKPGTTEGFPFGEQTLVFKVMDRMYALTGMETFLSINLKCDPELAVELREKYSGVQAGFHMNKKHWNTVLIGGSVSDAQLIEWIDHSYDLVAGGLTKALKVELALL